MSNSDDTIESLIAGGIIVAAVAAGLYLVCKAFGCFVEGAEVSRNEILENTEEDEVEKCTDCGRVFDDTYTQSIYTCDECEQKFCSSCIGMCPGCGADMCSSCEDSSSSPTYCSDCGRYTCIVSGCTNAACTTSYCTEHE